MEADAAPNQANDLLVRELSALAAQRILEAPSRLGESLVRLARWRRRTAG